MKTFIETCKKLKVCPSCLLKYIRTENIAAECLIESDLKEISQRIQFECNNENIEFNDFEICDYTL